MEMILFLAILGFVAMFLFIINAFIEMSLKRQKELNKAFLNAIAPDQRIYIDVCDKMSDFRYECNSTYYDEREKFNVVKAKVERANFELYSSEDEIANGPTELHEAFKKFVAIARDLDAKSNTRAIELIEEERQTRFNYFNSFFAH